MSAVTVRQESRVPALAEAKVAEVIRRTLEEPPPGETTHWTVRAMARTSGVSPAKVHQIWQAAGLAPHRYRRSKLSNDPAFAASSTTTPPTSIPRSAPG